MDYKNPSLIVNSSEIKPGSITWKSPSNLALVKYWGKHGLQLPRNPSISFTLSEAFTQTSLEYAAKTDASQEIQLDFYFDGEENEVFKTKLLKFLVSITEIFPFLKQLHLTIRSSNSFPHSSGIASSASSMSALALCLCSLEEKLFGTLKGDTAFDKKASFVSRLGSGSACRSVYAEFGLWGAMGEVEGSSDMFAIAYTEKIDPVFKTFHDAILISSAGEKGVSSRAGHGLMEGNPYAELRYTQARQHMHQLLSAMEMGDLERFGHIVENEALTLHALMMTSNPSYILLKPDTLHIIEKVRKYRKETGHPVYFSLDAGPNIHLLYPDAIKTSIVQFIENELVQHCENGRWISDKVGQGPEQL